MDLAVDLGTPVVTTHIGVVPEDPESPAYGVMADACRKIAKYAERRGVAFAVETGPEPPVRLRTFLEAVGSRWDGREL